MRARGSSSGLQRVAAVALLALLLCACGSAAHGSAKHVARGGQTRPALCLPVALSAIAHRLHVPSARISTSKQVASNGMPQCTFSDRHGAHAVAVVVNVDNGPQATFRLDRTVEEASQIFGPPPPGWQAPIGVSGLGQYASWFQTRDALMATNGTDVLTVTITWPHARQAEKIALARDAIGPYMKLGHGRRQSQ